MICDKCKRDFEELDYSNTETIQDLHDILSGDYGFLCEECSLGELFFDKEVSSGPKV